MNSSGVVAVIVTYGRRHAFCIDAATTALASGCGNVFIVDNASDQVSRTKIQEHFKSDSRVSIRTLSENRGSAGGFAEGLTWAASVNPSNIWLLDDDSLVAASALREALAVLENDRETSEKCAAFSYRPTNSLQTRTITSGGKTSHYPAPGSFLYFDLSHRILNVIDADRSDSRAWAVPYGPYGGLLLPGSVLDFVDPPDSALYLYEDDTEFTARLSRAGFMLLLAPTSVVEDADTKWSGHAPGRNGPDLFLHAEDEERRFYAIRNRVAFDRTEAERAGRMLAYRVNRSIYLACLWLFAVRGRRSSALYSIRHAVRAGEMREFLFRKPQGESS